jgi:glycosyltransferase involved in cell wall biosynthesis
MGHGGAEQNLVTMLSELQSGFEHHLVSLYEDDRLREAFISVAASVECLGVKRTSELPAAVARLTRRMHSRRVDVVSAQLLRAQTVARVAAAVARKPIVVTWQNTSYGEDSLSEFGYSRAKRLGSLALDRLTAVRDAATVAVSKAVRDENCRLLGLAPEAVHVIPNAIARERLTPASEAVRAQLRAELGVPPTAPLVLSVGRLVAQKAHRDAIKAMTEVLRARPEARYVIAGQGPLKDELQQAIASAGVSARVSLLGPRRDIPALLQTCDVFLFPSLFEGLPVALLEAIASGPQCVASDIPQNREAAENCSAVRFVPLGRPDAIAVGVLDALNAPQDTTADREQVRARFSATMVASRLGSVLRQAAG